jgi:carboxypeptidase Taq
MMNPIRERMDEVADVRAAIALLSWDQETYMPPKGAVARAEQLATLSALAHRLFTDPELGALLRDAADKAANPDDAKLISENLYDYDRATKLPETFVRQFAEAQSQAFNAWLTARKDSDFPAFRPHLEKIVALNRQMADLLGYEGSPYNALLEGYERGTTAAQLTTLFAELRPRQTALVRQLAASPNQPNLAWLARPWDTQAQWDFSIRVLRDMGYDFEAGRQDKAPHPFTTNFDIGDVRITTRISEDLPFSALMSSMHEGGHALYEQGFLTKDRRTVLASAPSLGIHESQSRMWENMVGRSRAFWHRYTPVFCEYFPGVAVDEEAIYRAINHVTPSLIRVEADECTYNLHIILRFEIELDLLEGRCNVRDVPELWNAKMAEYLGVEVPDDANGCLQDIHWSHGAMGYFPTYTLGNLYAAQLYESAQKQLGGIESQIAQGEFTPLLNWLREHVHRFGRRKTAVEIVREATGSEPTAAPYLTYLETKYKQLYSCS